MIEVLTWRRILNKRKQRETERDKVLSRNFYAICVDKLYK